jgi:trehalose 6-phosphate synthase
MNLVSYEYIATQEKRHGVMILSEFTGAAQSLNGSLIVNPWNTEELADSIHDAVTMGDEQRNLNYQKLSKYVRKYTSAWWGESFVNELRRISQTADRKVHFNNSKAEDTSAVEDGNTEALPKKDDTVPVKDKESDPATAVEAHQERKQDLPIRTKENES